MAEPNPEFLEIYVQDTDEQLRQIALAMRAWTEDRSNAAHAIETLRLIHAMEGAAGVLGLENIRAATQYFDRQVVRCREDAALPIGPLAQYVRFLNECNMAVHRGETLGSSTELVEQMKALGRE